MFFTSRELATVALTGADNYALDVRQEDGKWVVEVTVFDTGKQTRQKYFVQTNRGSTKTWRYLEDVMGFVDSFCANCQNLVIRINGKVWKLRAIDENSSEGQ
ncbi:hypothetical protein [Paraburkholderia megapolitana]|uniref:hypothetical protein n=1 Tax=Paraburkholderia megapolitana TaxID=420953 RepID=UPI0038BCFDE7